jgi:hypothetical protein
VFDARETFSLLLAPDEVTDWWAHLDGEDNKKMQGRLLVDTLRTWFMQRQHDSGRGRERRQYFFSPDARSCVDRRFDGVAVEEKVIELNVQQLIDGALGRSLVWVLGGRPRGERWDWDRQRTRAGERTEVIVQQDQGAGHPEMSAVALGEGPPSF